MSGYIDFILGFGLLAICGIQDMRRRKIRVMVPLLFGGAGCCMHMASGGFWQAMAGCLPGIMLLGVCRLTGGAVGAGDGLVLAAAGIFIGFSDSMLLLFWAMAAAALAGCVMIMAGKWGRKQQIPFVPFLWGAYLGVMLWR